MRRTVRTVLAVAVAVAAVAAALSFSASAATPRAATPRAIRAAAPAPLRAAFYYPWFPQTWHDDDQFHPTLGRYSSDQRSTVGTHIKEMKYAGLGAAIISWWGRGEQHEDTRVPLLLRQSAKLGFHIAPYYEPAGQSPTPTTDQISSDLSYLHGYVDRFPGSFLTVRGKPVIFVYNAVDASCADVRRWSRATHRFRDWYVSLKVFPGFADCTRQPSTWHQYGPASAYSTQAGYYATVSPGFFHHGEASPRLPRSRQRFCYDAGRVADSKTRWQLVTTFNEWGEGTAVESAQEWATKSGNGAYLDILRRVFIRGKRCPAPG